MPKEKFSSEEAYKEGQGVQAWAESLAEKNGDGHPSAEHYEKASEIIDAVRKLDPVLADRQMESAAKAREWENAIGADMYKKLRELFQDSWTESLSVTSTNEKFSRDAALEDTKQRMNKRLKGLFKGKEQMLPAAREIVNDLIEHNKLEG